LLDIFIYEATVVPACKNLTIKPDIFLLIHCFVVKTLALSRMHNDDVFSNGYWEN
jgi:hypothetical protein